jgi:hypothetical protein
MTSAARRALRIRDGLEAVAEWEKQHGPFTEEELEAARARVRREHGARVKSRRSRA